MILNLNFKSLWEATVKMKAKDLKQEDKLVLKNKEEIQHNRYRIELDLKEEAILLLNLLG